MWNKVQYFFQILHSTLIVSGQVIGGCEALMRTRDSVHVVVLLLLLLLLLRRLVVVRPIAGKMTLRHLSCHFEDLESPITNIEHSISILIIFVTLKSTLQLCNIRFHFGFLMAFFTSN